MLSSTLEQTLQRALILAGQNHHEFITLEHLLFALCDDRDAMAVFAACRTDLELLRQDVDHFLSHEQQAIIRPELDDAPQPTAAFQRVIQRAAVHIQSAGQAVMTGAHVLISMFAEKESHAVFFLHQRGLTRLNAIHAMQHDDVATSPHQADSTGRKASPPPQGGQ